jgi:hypothetical protein
MKSCSSLPTHKVARPKNEEPVVTLYLMAHPARSSLPAELEPLAKTLAALGPATRAAVVARAALLATQPRPAASWETVTALGGIVCLGGDAVADTDALYDG